MDSMTVILKRLLPTIFLLAVLLTGTVLAEASPEITDARDGCLLDAAQPAGRHGPLDAFAGRSDE